MTDILSLGRDVATELLISSPAGLVAETDNHEAQAILRHMTRTCRQLAARHDWARLRRETTFLTVSAVNTLPSDMLRLVQETMFNRTSNTRVTGPLTPEEWQQRQASLTTNVYDEFYIRGSSLLITPTPPAGETIAYEYITKYIAVASDTTTERMAFTDDGDEPYFDDELVILGTVWRYRKAEGTDYAEEKLEYEMRVADLIKMDGGRRILNMNGGSAIERYPYPPRVPETLIFT